MSDVENLVTRYCAEMGLSDAKTRQLLWHTRRCKRCLSKLREHFELRDRVDAALAYIVASITGVFVCVAGVNLAALMGHMSGSAALSVLLLDVVSIVFYCFKLRELQRLL